MTAEKNTAVISTAETKSIKDIFKAAILESKNREKSMSRQGCATGGGTNS